MADLQASIEDLWERRGDLSPKDGDAVRLHRLLTNMVDNAVRHARSSVVGSSTPRKSAMRGSLKSSRTVVARRRAVVSGGTVRSWLSASSGSSGPTTWVEVFLCRSS